MKLPSVCVVIPSYNSGEFIVEGLNTVLVQTHSPDEIIVVDDGSSGNTHELLRSYLDRVKYFKQSNAGPATARNHGIANTRCEWVAFLDADDWWSADKLEAQMTYAAHYPKASQVGASSTNKPPDASVRNTVTFIERKEFLGPIPFGISSLVARRDKLLEVGLFDVNHFCAAEDRDLLLKLSLAGDSLHVNSALWTYRVHPGQGSRNAQRMVNSYSRVLNEFFDNHPELERGILVWKFLLGDDRFLAAVARARAIFGPRR